MSNSIVEATQNRVQKGFVASLTSIEDLTSQEKEYAWEQLDPATQKTLASTLRPLNRIYDQHPLRFVTDIPLATKDNLSNDGLSILVGSALSRHQRHAALTMAAIQMMALSQDKIRMPKELFDKTMASLDNIEHYPKTELSRSAASMFRAGVPMFFLHGQNGEQLKSSKWVSVFWDGISKLENCNIYPNKLEKKPLPINELNRFITEFENSIIDEFDACLKYFEFGSEDLEPNEVLSSLLSRQATLSIQIARNPNCWNPHIAPIILRSMADCHISIAWIVGDTLDRSKKFISDGLGAAKLQIHHHEEAIKYNSDPIENSKINQMISHLNDWVESQRMKALVEVNLGSWSGYSTRKMATEAGCLDFYNYVYQPFSAVTHSSWLHVGRLNVGYCSTPSHRGHVIGQLNDIESDLEYLYLSSKYWLKSLNVVREYLDLPKIDSLAFDRLMVDE